MGTKQETISYICQEIHVMKNVNQSLEMKNHKGLLVH